MPRAKGYTKEDLAEVLDNPEWTEEDFARGRRLEEVLPGLARRIQESKTAKPGKERVSLELDRDVIARFQAEGRDWRARINRTLRKAVGL
jgi:uncharacterized protein (DUF4415 family)